MLISSGALVRLLDSTEAQTVAATHSPEMLAEAPSEPARERSEQERETRGDAAARSFNQRTFLEDLSTQIGSSFNLRLAAALRARTVVFVEGDDMSIIGELAETVGADHLAGERNCAVIEIKGFTNWVQVGPSSGSSRNFTKVPSTCMRSLCGALRDHENWDLDAVCTDRESVNSFPLCALSGSTV